MGFSEKLDELDLATNFLHENGRRIYMHVFLCPLCLSMFLYNFSLTICLISHFILSSRSFRYSSPLVTLLLVTSGPPVARLKCYPVLSLYKRRTHFRKMVCLMKNE